MAENKWFYEKLDEEMKLKRAPQNDYDGSVTGKIVIGVQEWFDENPEERIRLGWTKHIQHDTKDIEYNRQTQYLARAIKRVDAYTVEDEYRIIGKSEEQMLLEEYSSNGVIYGDGTIMITGME